MRRILKMKPKYIELVIENIEEELEHIRKRVASFDKSGDVYFYLRGMGDGYENILNQLTEEDKRR